MARPQEYEGPRVDTKVRLRPDHARLLREASDERGLGRNRLVEMALDAFFGIKSTAPKLKRTPVDPNLQGGPRPRSTARVSTRLARPGQAFENQAEAAAPRRRSP